MAARTKETQRILRNVLTIVISLLAFALFSSPVFAASPNVTVSEGGGAVVATVSSGFSLS